MHLFDADLLALQNNLGRGEPLDVSSPKPNFSRTVSKCRAGGSGSCSVGIWVSPRTEVPPPFWATWPSAWPLSSCRFFVLNLVEISLVATGVQCLLSVFSITIHYLFMLQLFTEWLVETDTLNSCQAEINKIRTCWAEASAGQERGTVGLSSQMKCWWSYLGIQKESWDRYQNASLWLCLLTIRQNISLCLLCENCLTSAT